MVGDTRWFKRTMTDRELVTFLGLDDYDPVKVKRIIDGLTPEKRAVYDKMREIELWDQGLGPLPDGVMPMKRATYLGRDTRTKLAVCLDCGKGLDGAISVGSRAKPRPGAIAICDGCGHIQVFDWDMKFRELTNSEMCEIAGDPRIIAVQRARAMRKGVMPRGT